MLKTTLTLKQRHLVKSRFSPLSFTLIGLLSTRTRMASQKVTSEPSPEFRDVPDTFLMFLNRLQRLSIELYPPADAPTSIIHSKRETMETGLYSTFLTKTVRRGEEESSSEQKYYSIKSDIHGLPFDEARKDKSGNGIHQATVIVAFPVDTYDAPVLKQQYTYAFLPLRHVGFNFLIQADFITQANREDVVHCKRNQAILEKVAEVFADAVLYFCSHPSLKYQWMRYLPEESIADTFWKGLWPLIREKLKQTPLLEPLSGKGLRKPSDLRQVPETYVNENGSPLLPDLEGAEIYLSPKYTQADYRILRRLRTTKVTTSIFLDRLEADLYTHEKSRWRSMDNSADWRTRICRLLLTILTNNSNEPRHLTVQARLKALALIPLRDGEWGSNSIFGARWFYPKINDVLIPTDLGFRIVHLITTENAAWTELLSGLGVEICPQDFLVSSIYKRYNVTSLDKFNVSDAIRHLECLYRFLPKDHMSLAPQFRLVNQHGSLLKKHQYLYFPEDADEYSPAKLFRHDTHLPGHPVHYLHDDYLNAVNPDFIHNGRSWTSWLEEIVGVRRIPELCAKSSDALSKEFQYIIKYQSKKLLGLLRRGWSHYRRQMKEFTEEELRNSLVLLESGLFLEAGCRTPLLRTFLPLPKLKETATELGIANAYPFIAISEIIQDRDRSEWTFLENLQIGMEDDLGFYLSALETFTKNTSLFPASLVRDRVIRIYQNIQSGSSGDLDKLRYVCGIGSISRLTKLQ